MEPPRLMRTTTNTHVVQRETANLILTSNAKVDSIKIPSNGLWSNPLPAISELSPMQKVCKWVHWEVISLKCEGGSPRI